MSNELRSIVPPLALEALERYRDHHIPTGSFLQAVLENNLLEAINRADPDSLQALPAICRFVHHQLPLLSHGSPAKVTAWIRDGQRAKAS